MSQLRYTCSVGGRAVESTVDSSEKRGAPVSANDLFLVHNAARSEAKASASTPVTCSRVVREKPRMSEDMQWIRRKMTPSCAKYGWDLNQVVSYDTWTCNYLGKGTIVGKDGKKSEVYNPLKTWSGKIASCTDLGHESDLSISDETMESVRKMAYHQADGDNAGLDETQFLCRVESLPRV